MKKTGTVKMYDYGRGYGFIIPNDDDSADIFVHRSKVAPNHLPLATGEIVSYDLAQDPDGRLCAANVKRCAW